ncbi:hypothetical protein [Burkholderia lata]|uniref:hypothetical protein n=1 Tax=Burkholderia lata (strain ATCC 17760 / DSM 23089 / LMG 22485 / NCIMB 9086 / R18194 / 383) TaxID=482957 RepID=UPI00399A6B21
MPYRFCQTIHFPKVNCQFLCPKSVNINVRAYVVMGENYGFVMVTSPKSDVNVDIAWCCRGGDQKLIELLQLYLVFSCQNVQISHVAPVLNGLTKHLLFGAPRHFFELYSHDNLPTKYGTDV